MCHLLSPIYNYHALFKCAHQHIPFVYKFFVPPSCESYLSRPISVPPSTLNNYFYRRVNQNVYIIAVQGTVQNYSSLDCPQSRLNS